MQVSTKLNRSHLVHGRTALILPSLGRTDRDIQSGRKQFVSVEDSMSIICGLARALLGPQHPVPWEHFASDNDSIRDAIAAVVPGCEDYNARVRQPDGFQLPHPPRDMREFPTRQSQFPRESAAVGAGAAGTADTADATQSRPVQHHCLRPR